MPYFAITDMQGLVPEAWLSDGMDDAGTGHPDAFAAVLASASNAIDANLSARYAVPLDTTNVGLNAVVKEIGVCIAVETIYIRRQAVIDEKSLLGKRIARAWDRLKALAEGTDPLSTTVKRATDSIVTIEEPSRTSSCSLAA